MTSIDKCDIIYLCFLWVIINHFERFLKSNGVEIIVVNNEKASPEQELVNDLISIIHVFSCRIYGLRKYKKQISGDEDIAKELQDRNKSDTWTETDN